VAGGDEIAFLAGRRQISGAGGVEGGGDTMRFGVNMFGRMAMKAGVVFIVGIV
jgi:hypothetical protein